MKVMAGQDQTIYVRVELNKMLALVEAAIALASTTQFEENECNQPVLDLLQQLQSMTTN